MNELNLKIAKNVVALLCVLVCANYVSAQNVRQPGSDALRIYYSDLYNRLSVFDITDIPFTQNKVTVQHGDSLLKIAKEHRIKELDSYHLAAAIYEVNLHAFTDGDAARLPVGARINLPNIGDLIFAQDRYEKLKVSGNTVDFNNPVNQMHAALRWPFGKALVLKEPGVQAGSESQIATLTDYQLDGLGGEKPRKKNTSPSARAETISVATNTVKNDEPPLAAALDSKTAANADQNTTTTNTTTHATEPQTATVTAENNVTPLATKIAIDTSDTDYLGPPRNTPAAAGTDNPSDPLSYTIEWAFNEHTQVGIALDKLADYIGYELINDNKAVLAILENPLQHDQLEVSGITTAEGFEILAGNKLETIFDHVSRSIAHLPKDIQLATSLASPGTSSLATAAAPANKETPEAMVSKSAIGETRSATFDTDVTVAQRSIDASPDTKIYKKLLAQSGVAAMLQNFPADIESAAQRHAARCESVPSRTAPEAQQLHHKVVSNLQQKAPAPIIRNLVNWYESPTGIKALQLEQGTSVSQVANNNSNGKARAAQIEQIYDNTITGKGIASIAIALDYAGWSLSGCKQKAEVSGDVEQMQSELNRARKIKSNLASLESGLRADMLLAMTDQYAPMTNTELAEYSAVIRNHSGLLAELQQSVVDAIAFKTKEINASISY